MTRPLRGHRLLPHTADLIVSAWAPTALDCLDEAVRGLVGAFAAVPDTAPRTARPFVCGPDTDTELLVRVLDEVIYLLDVSGLVATGAVLARTADGGLTGHLPVVAAATVRPTGPVPKAVTRHGLRFGPDNGTWHAIVTIDV